MPAYLKPQEWLSVVRTEYLESFIHAGGAAVKFVIPSEEFEVIELKSGLERLAQESGFHFASVDASATKIDRIEQLFYDVAKGVDWEGLAYSFLRRSLESHHYKLPDAREPFSLKNLAVLNKCEESDMQSEVNGVLRSEILRDYAMTQEFRRAMFTLCKAQIDPPQVTADVCESIRAWLQGELRLITAVKPALIFQKIGRHNARHLLFSLAHWLKLSGSEGLVLLLDISRYLSEKPKGPVETPYYSKPAVLDCYEVLRQFIDETDEAEFLLTVVLASTRFLNEDERRSVHWYQALKLRIWNEVQDKIHANPLSPLVRISSCSHAETERGQGL